MMILLVDFNRLDKVGRVSALVPAGHEHDLVEGTKLTITDGEGTECRAVVDEIGHNGLYVKLVPVAGTFRRDSRLRPSAQGVLAS